MTIPATQTRSTSPLDDLPSPAAELVPAAPPAASPSRLVGAGASPGADERRLTFTSSPTIGSLIEALALAQLEFTAIERALTAHVESKRTGIKFDYDYADLASVLSAVRPALAKHGIATLQPAMIGLRSVTITTLLAHKSGEFIRNDFSLPLDSSDPQAVGSAVTYARRYALQSLLGVAPEVDDDAAAAGGGRSFQRARDDRASSVRPGSGPVSMPQRAESAAPPSFGAPPTPSAAPVSRPGPVPVAQTPPVFTITAVREQRTAGGKPYWVAAFSDGRTACTFSTTMRDALQRGYDQRRRYSDLSITTKGKWTYIDELFVADGGAA